MDVLTPLPFCGVRATRATAQSITNNADNYISLTAIAYDVGTWYAGGNPTRLTVPAAANGRQLLIVGSVDLAGNATGIRSAWIRANGSTRQTENVVLAPGTAHAGFSITTTATGVTGDYYELGVFQNSGGALNTQVSIFVTSLSVVVLG